MEIKKATHVERMSGPSVPWWWTYYKLFVIDVPRELLRAFNPALVQKTDRDLEEEEEKCPSTYSGSFATLLDKARQNNNNIGHKHTKHGENKLSF